MSRETGLMPSGSMAACGSKPCKASGAAGHGAKTHGRLVHAGSDSVPADQSHEPSLHADAVGAIQSRFIGRVGSFERNGVTATPQTLQRGFLLIDQRNHNIAGASRIALL